MQRYRSGHNEAVLKTVCPQGRVGSSPTLCAKEKSWVLCKIRHISQLFLLSITTFSVLSPSALFLYALNIMLSKFFHQIFRNKLNLFVCTAESKLFTIGTCIELKKHTTQNF